MHKVIDPFRFLLIAVAGWMNEQQPFTIARPSAPKQPQTATMIFRQMRPSAGRVATVVVGGVTV
jgi:hypothetical protein